MLIAARGNETHKIAWQKKTVPASVEVIWNPNPTVSADAYFDFLWETEGAYFQPTNQAPVFVHAVLETTASMQANFIRFCAWPGFFERSLLEIAAKNDRLSNEGELILEALTWDFQLVPDQIGFVSPRVISMIINEAYFALGEKVSSKEEIDIAMLLGTNYPKGPFVWAAEIGLLQIYQLLQHLWKAEGERYAPAQMLVDEVKSLTS